MVSSLLKELVASSIFNERSIHQGIILSIKNITLKYFFFFNEPNISCTKQLERDRVKIYFLQFLYKTSRIWQSSLFMKKKDM